jgi:dTDP-4-dehydrorhamnose 3,5-epimerase-like enzyme
MKFKNICNKYGNLVPIEQKIDLPFKIKRVYYIYGVNKDLIRGNHAHKKIHQVLICVKGSVKIKIKTPKEEAVYELNNPSEGLYIGVMLWREMYDFSEDAVLLVLASEYYDKDDYIRNYDFYLDEAKELF